MFFRLNNEKKESGHPTFGNSVRKPLNLLGKDTPGPGNYEHIPEGKVYKSAPSYSISLKKKKNSVDRSSFGPGPGAYSINKVFQLGRTAYRKPNSTFPKADRFKGPKLRGRKTKKFFEEEKEQNMNKTLKLTKNLKRIDERLNQSVNDYKYDSTPGPGDYDISNGGIGTGFAKEFNIEDIKFRNSKSIGRRYQGKEISFCLGLFLIFF